MGILISKLVACEDNLGHLSKLDSSVAICLLSSECLLLSLLDLFLAALLSKIRDLIMLFLVGHARWLREQ